MDDASAFAPRFRLPAHLSALQLLVNRCPTAVSRKRLIVAAGSLDAISPDDAFVMMTANMLETV